MAPRSLVALNRVGAPYNVLVLFMITGGLLLAFVTLTILLRCSILGVLLVYAGGLLAWLLWSRRLVVVVSSHHRGGDSGA